MPPSFDIGSLEHSTVLVIKFCQNVLALVRICRRFKHAQVIDRANTLKAKVHRKGRPTDAQCESGGLVGDVDYESTAGLLEIQSGPGRGFGDDVCRGFVVRSFIRTLRAVEGDRGTFAFD